MQQVVYLLFKGLAGSRNKTDLLEKRIEITLHYHISHLNSIVHL